MLIIAHIGDLDLQFRPLDRAFGATPSVLPFYYPVLLLPLLLVPLLPLLPLLLLYYYYLLDHHYYYHHHHHCHEDRF